MTYTEEVGNKVNNLLEKAYDAEKGFKKAADNVNYIPLRIFFERQAQEHYDFGHALKKEIQEFGTAVDKGGSLTGKAHRSWMDIKTLFSTDNEEVLLDNEEVLLKEAIKGEKAAFEEYTEVLKDTTLLPTTENLPIKQKNEIEQGINTIKSLEDLK